jgi:hypothetical protein
MQDNDDTSQITRKEARDALTDPEKGSLRVLKALGKQVDIYSSELSAGNLRLVAHNDLEIVAAEEAIRVHTEDASAQGETLPKISIFKSGGTWNF